VKAVTVNNLVVQFGAFKAVNNVSFEVEQGEIFGFLGANGAGKTTTIRVLCGLLIPSAGTALVAGENVADDPNAVKSSVGYMSQKFTLYRDMTIEENLSFTGHLRRMDEALIEKRIKELTAFIELEWPLSTMVRDLPGGVLQQVSLVAATLHDPKIVFLDEPTAGVTPHARFKFWELIRALRDKGKTVFVTTHYMDEAEQCGRVALMRSGELIALDSPDGLKARTFPDPIYEITPPAAPPARWKEDALGKKVASSIEIFGMRYHAEAPSSQAFESYFKATPGFAYKRIKPSLEDVFIRLVEGKNR
jgi:ABC-2 type transport system ATP-binding protein